MRHYAVSVIPAAHKQAVNRLIAAIEGEDILASENLSRDANATGSPSDPATHWFGGRWVSAEWLAIYQTMGADLDVTQVAFPLIIDDEEVLGEAEAQAAAQALVIAVTTSDDDAQQPQQTLSAVMDSLGLLPIQQE